MEWEILCDLLLVHMVTSPCLQHHKLLGNLYIFFHTWSLIYPESLPTDCYSFLSCQRRAGQRSGLKNPLLTVLSSIQYQCLECERKTPQDYQFCGTIHYCRASKCKWTIMRKKVHHWVFFAAGKCGIVAWPKTLCIRRWSIEKLKTRI